MWWKRFLFVALLHREKVWKGVARLHTAEITCSIDGELLNQPPLRLLRQAGNIAQRVLKEIIYANEK